MLHYTPKYTDFEFAFFKSHGVKHLLHKTNNMKYKIYKGDVFYISMLQRTNTSALHCHCMLLMVYCTQQKKNTTLTKYSSVQFVLDGVYAT